MQSNTARWRLARTAALASALLLTGCSSSHLHILFPGSATATTQRDLLFIAVAVMLAVLIPVWLMAMWFPWRYRAGGDGAYDPEWTSSALVETVVWMVPALIVVIIGALVWVYSHQLDPYRQVGGPGKLLKIDAVSLDWKWVFLYPGEKGATVNELVLPMDRPVELNITSDTVMNSLFIPGLAGQIYAMAGMQTKLNFRPTRPGTYFGRNMQYSGGYFPEQHFQVKVVSAADYAGFLDRLAKSSDRLTNKAYDALEAKRATSPVHEYAGYAPGLYKRIIDKYCATDCAPAAPAQERQ